MKVAEVEAVRGTASRASADSGNDRAASAKRELAALRADVNPSLWGVLYDLQGTWTGIGPRGEYFQAGTSDELRRAIQAAEV